MSKSALLQKILEKLNSSDAKLTQFISDQSETNREIADHLKCLPDLIATTKKHEALLLQLSKQNSVLRREVDQLKSASTCVLAKNASSDIIIAGVPSAIPESMQQITAMVFDALGISNLIQDVLGCRIMNPKPSAASVSHSAQTNRTESTSSLVVSLKSMQVRDYIISKKRVKRTLLAKDVFSRDIAATIYINELLPPLLYNLLIRTKTKAKSLSYKYVWVKSGCIAVRRDDGAPITMIRSDADLA